jgi:hypothetical protein
MNRIDEEDILTVETTGEEKRIYSSLIFIDLYRRSSVFTLQILFNFFFFVIKVHFDMYICMIEQMTQRPLF